jgi:7-keto-8-aminopelargonate synthetase-like enzyme
MGSLDRFAAEKLAALSARSLRRELAAWARAQAAKLSRDGRQLISFSCNDYLNLSTHPRIIEAAVAATRDYGVGAGGSRAITAAAIAALDFLADNPEYCARPVAKARRFTAALGLAEAQSPIVPVIIGSATAALSASKQLAAEGFLVTAIRPPTVVEGTARLRFTFCAAHEDADIDRLAALVRQNIMAPA